MKLKNLLIILGTITISITVFFISLYVQKLSIFDRMPVFAISREITSVDVLFSFGNAEGEDQQLKQPIAIAVDSEGKAYVLDSFHRDIKVYDPNGTFLFAFGKGGEDLLLAPGAIAIHNGLVLVSEPTIGRIQAFSTNGEFVRTLFASSKTEKYSPVGMAGLDDHLLFADAARHQLVKINLDGEVIATYGSPGPKEGQFAYPQYITIDQNERIYVSDSNNGRVQVFDEEGKYLQTIDGTIGEKEKMALPRGIAIDRYHRLIVVDTLANQLRFFELTGEPLFEYGEHGEDDGQLSFPNGVATFGNKVYIADRENNRIQVFSIGN